MNDLKITFLEEALLLLSKTESFFLRLEQNPKDFALLEQVFRFIHNLKGSAQAVGLDPMGKLAHEMESLLFEIQSHELSLVSELCSLFLKCNHRMILMAKE